MHEIFISYRQDDSAAWALLLRDALVARFGTRRVYLDKDSQQAGSWKDQIEAGLARSKVVLVPIGPRWLDARTKEGVRRLDMPDDVHRWEIAKALAMSGITVIPVLVDDATLPREDQLSADLQALPRQQYREISGDAVRRDVDIARLIVDIERATGLAARKTKSATSAWLHGLGLLVSSFVVTLVALAAVDQVLESQPLGFEEKVWVYIFILALVMMGRHVVRHFRKGE